MIQCSLRGFSVKPSTASPVDLGDAPLQVGPDDGDGGQRAALAVEVEQRIEVDVGDAVGVGRAEALLAEPLGERASRPPVGVSSPVSTHSTSHPVGPALGRGELRDDLAQVAGGEQEALEALRGVDLDHVPEDRPAADLDQRLRQRFGPLTQARAAAAAEDHDGRLHRLRVYPTEWGQSGRLQPPATAGRIVISLPSLIAVSETLL